MSSVGQAVGGIVGAVAGFILGGPAGAWSGAFRGFSIGATIGGMLDPPKGPNQVGPRLTDLSTQTSTYGTSIPRIYGTMATMGNIFWIEGDRLKEVATVSKQKGGKGGGGKATTTTYSYYATFAVGLCQGPIAGVRRIWIGSKLIYDAGSDDLETVMASNAAAAGFKVYLGTEDQTADPRMAADKGVANVPGYRGLAYIVFYDYALKDHGNSLMGAQVKVEVVHAASYAWKRSLACANTGVRFAAWSSGGGAGVGTPLILGVENGLVTVGAIGGGAKAYRFDQTSGRYVGSIPSYEMKVPDYIEWYYVWKHLGPHNGRNYFCRIDGRYDGGHYPGSEGVIAYGDVVQASGPSFYIDGTRVDAGIIAYRVANGLSATYTIHSCTKSTTTDEFIVLTHDCQWYLIDLDGALIDHGTHGFSGAWVIGFAEFSYDGTTKNGVSFPGGDYFYTYETVGDAFVRVSMFEAKGGLDLWLGSLATWIEGSMITIVCKTTLSVWNYAYTDGALPTLSSVVNTECALSRLIAAADIDTSALTQTVRGYRVTETGSIRAALEPLQGLYPFDVVQAGYKIKFVPRGQSSVATIDQGELGAVKAGDTPGAALTVAREMESQLPCRVSLKYFDATREYDISEQYAERLNTDAVNQQDMQVAVVLTASEAAGVAERLVYLYWLERYTATFTLPAIYGYLEPSDVITLTGDQGTFELRLTNINYTSNGLLECTARYNNAAVYTPVASGEEGQGQGQTLAFAGASYYVLLDIPCLLDTFNAPGFGAAMCGYASGWPGGILLRSSDQGQTWTDAQGFTDAAPIGFTITAFAAGRTDIIDSANILGVSMLSGDLDSVTELQMLNGANHFAIGAHGRWEIVAAKNCVLQSDGSYLLSDFLRGRYGTEWAMSLHAIGDTIVLLSDSSVAFVGAESASIGAERLYRGVTSGAAVDSDADLSFTYSGVNLECLAPVYLNGSRHPTTRDWTLTWIRRTRIDGSLRNYVDAALGETTEAYEIDIYDGATYATVKRTLTATSATVAYTSTQQVTDFGSDQATLYVKVYQLSATVGRGYPLTTSITRG